MPITSENSSPLILETNIGVKMSDKVADMNTYTSIMEEIKKRTELIMRLIHGEINMVWVRTQAETVALQMRMIIESVALASLSANKSEFEKEGNKFKKFWKADRIFEDIEKKNPKFYPQPIKEHLLDKSIPINSYNFRGHWTEIETGFMTRNKIVEVHSKCCDILHAPNPYYENKRNYETFLTQSAEWIELIIKLLNSHIIQLLDNSNLYLVHMREDENNGQVRMYDWTRLEGLDNLNIPFKNKM